MLSLSDKDGLEALAAGLRSGKPRKKRVTKKAAAAAKATQLVREGKAELLMKGSLHTDELMREVVGGRRTSEEVVAWTSDFFRHIGKSVITMDREVPGFIANRLQEALWREALHMVANGEATVEQIDASITEGDSGTSNMTFTITYTGGATAETVLWELWQTAGLWPWS